MRDLILTHQSTAHALTRVLERAFTPPEEIPLRIVQYLAVASAASPLLMYNLKTA